MSRRERAARRLEREARRLEAPGGPIPGPGGVGQLIYEAGATGLVRAVAWFLFAVMLFALVAARATYLHMVTEPQVLAPHGQRLAFALVIGGLGVAMFAGMWFYLRIYTMSLVLLPEEGRLRVLTPTMFGTRSRDLPVDALGKATFHNPLANPRLRRLYVNAPWYWVSVRGGGSFLLDLNAQVHDAGALNRLFGI